jgi:hypothetical protein
VLDGPFTGEVLLSALVLSFYFPCLRLGIRELLFTAARTTRSIRDQLRRLAPDASTTGLHVLHDERSVSSHCWQEQSAREGGSERSGFFTETPVIFSWDTDSALLWSVHVLFLRLNIPPFLGARTDIGMKPNWTDQAEMSPRLLPCRLGARVDPN